MSEGGDAVFTVAATSGTASSVDVTVEVSQQGAFTANTGSRTVTVSADGTATVTIPTADDSADEPDGSITARVQSGTGYTVGSPSTATVAVADDDIAVVLPTVTITGGTGVSEGGDAVFTVSASSGTASSVDVTVEVSQKGAFTTNTGSRTVTVSAGGTATVTIPTADDSADEPDGSITATIQSGTGYAVGSPSTATVAVTDNDDPPAGNSATLTVAVASPVGRVRPGGELHFKVALSEAAQQDVTITAEVSSLNGGGLYIGSDYTVRGWTKTQISGQITIAKGQSETTLTVEIDDNAYITSYGLILIHLTGVQGAKSITQSYAQGGVKP